MELASVIVNSGIHGGCIGVLIEWHCLKGYWTSHALSENWPRWQEGSVQLLGNHDNEYIQHHNEMKDDLFPWARIHSAYMVTPHRRTTCSLLCNHFICSQYMTTAMIIKADQKPLGILLSTSYIPHRTSKSQIIPDIVAQVFYLRFQGGGWV